jgi:hypothetical protein
MDATTGAIRSVPATPGAAIPDVWNAESVIEYLIRNVGDKGWPGVHRDRLSIVLTPVDGGWVPIDGWGDHRLRRGETEVSFSIEEVGWQVSFEGPIGESDAQHMIDAVAGQVQQEVGEPVEVVQIS